MADRVPLIVATTLSRLATRHGTERVLEEVKRWVAYIEEAKRLAGRYYEARTGG